MTHATQAYRSLTKVEKQRIQEIDCNINGLEREVGVLNKFIYNTEKEWALMEAKLKKEKLKALTALSKSRVLLAEMEIFIAENELNKKLRENSDEVTQDGKNKPSGKTSAKSKRRYTPSETPRKTPSPCSSSSSRSGATSSQDGSTKSYSPEEVPRTEGKESTQKNTVCNVKANVSTSSPTLNSASQSNTSSNSSINKSLTESIIAEFDKPYSKVIDSLNNSIDCSSTPKLDIKNPPKKRKIQPVSNVEVYKKHALGTPSFKSQVLHTPPATEKPSHLRDPRSYQSNPELNTKRTTMKLTLPQIDNSNTPLKPSENRRGCQYVTTPLTIPKQSNACIVRTPGYYIPVTSTPEHQNASNFTPQHPSNTVRTSQSSQHTVRSVPRQHVSSSVTSIQKQGYYSHNYLPYPPNNPANHQVNMLTPTNSQHGNATCSVTLGNQVTKHICVPAAPVYSQSTCMYSVTQMMN